MVCLRAPPVLPALVHQEPLLPVRLGPDTQARLANMALHPCMVSRAPQEPMAHLRLMAHQCQCMGRVRAHTDHMELLPGHTVRLLGHMVCPRGLPMAHLVRLGHLAPTAPPGHKARLRARTVFLAGQMAATARTKCYPISSVLWR